MAKTARGPRSRLVALGRDPDLTGPFVNPPVVRASTVLFPTAAKMLANDQRYVYGRRGTPTSEALATAISHLHGAAGTVLCPSGLSACTTALLAVVAAGDHVLVTDAVYGPTRLAVQTLLKRLGVDATFYDPRIGAGIGELFTGRTRAVYVESPGSHTFEMQDLPAIAEVAHAREAVVLADNTWASPLACRPLDHGADIAIEAGTKYFGGHSDVSIGTVSATAAVWERVKTTHGTLGLTLAPDDIFLTLRGLRTLALRLERHLESALKVADWLSAHPAVVRVLFPPHPADDGHALWQRDMTGGGGLLAVVFDGWPREAVMACVDGLEMFGIGWSWGGYESLVAVGEPERYRSAPPWHEGTTMRLFVGLEDADDLIADLDQALRSAAPG